jgi:hypothetical protein
MRVLFTVIASAAAAFGAPREALADARSARPIS